MRRLLTLSEALGHLVYDAPLLIKIGVDVEIERGADIGMTE